MAQRAAPTSKEGDLERCERRIGYEFKDKALLVAALTHASGAHHRLASNERLEFLGDAILGAVVCELLYLQYPDYLEGDLTKVKSVVVSRQTCAKISEGLGLQEFLILGKGMTTHPQVPPSLLADVFESLAAAIYLDGGDAGARDFIQRFMEPEIELAAAGELAATTSRCCSNWPSAKTARRRPISFLTKRVRTTASASRSPLRSGEPSTSPLGAGTKKKPSNAPPAMPWPSSTTKWSPSLPIDGHSGFSTAA